MEHFLAVARIALILNLKEQLKTDEELIYAAALLHDIGRHIQYEDGTPHERASARIASGILDDCGFLPNEKAVILEAILKHRAPEAALENNLSALLYRADKLSRPCFACPSEAECRWKEGKKNKELVL